MLHAKPKHLPGLIPKASRPKRAISCGRPACAIATRTFELTVPWSAGPVEAGLAVAIAQEDDAPVEFVTLRVDAADVFPTPQLPELPPGGKSRRRDRRLPADIVRWGWIEAPIYDRARLGAGAVSTARRLSVSSTPPPCCSDSRNPFARQPRRVQPISAAIGPTPQCRVGRSLI